MVERSNKINRKNNISFNLESNATYLARSADNAKLGFYDKLQKIK